MPVEPLRERVMAWLADRLTTIRAGTVLYQDAAAPVEYWTTPSVVTRSPLWITQYEQPLAPPLTATQLDAGPVLGVIRGSGSTFDRLLHIPDTEAAVTGFEHMQRVTVWGFAKKTADVLAGTWIERLWQDHLACLLVDRKCGGLALDCWPEGPIDTDDGALEPLAYFAQDWVIRA